MESGAPQEAPTEGPSGVDAANSGDAAEGAPPPEKKRRGKPKDDLAPPKPKSPFQKFGAEARARLKEERPELVTDLSGMGKALAEEWGKVPEEEKARMQEEYQKEMVVWKPKWEEYKQTDHYKKFVEIKTDYLDIKAQKKLKKKMNANAPKRPRSGYMIFAGEVREGIMEEIKKEGLGLGEAGKRISDRWGALDEAEKARYAEISVQQKATFEVEFLKYRKSEDYSNYMDAKTQLESTQQLKKNTRVSLDGAPKKAPSSYALFRKDVMPGIIEENDQLKEGEKLSVGGIGKKIAGMWTEVPEDKKEEYRKQSDTLKQEYDAKLKAFKSQTIYRDFLQKRQKIKVRCNTQLNLRDMPKRPKSVFGLFAADHKNEVEPGKGEGKGTHALKQKWAEATPESRKEYESKEQELKEQWVKDVQEFKDGERYKTFEQTKTKIANEFKNEAIKVTTMKFLSEAPKEPPKTPFAVLLAERRKKLEGEGGELSKQAKQEQLTAVKNEWLKLDKNVKNEYEVRRKELQKDYEDTVKQFMQTDRWQEYIKEAKRAKIPVKSLLFHKKKVMKKIAKGMKPLPSSIPLPSKPLTFPSKPKNAVQIFTAEKRSEVEAISEIGQMWSNLDDAGKKPYHEKATEDMSRFKEEAKDFKQSDEGKRYNRDLASALKRRRILAARNRFLDDMPKKPKAAVVLWMQEQLPQVKKENRGLKGFEYKKLLNERWSNLPDSEKAPIEEAGHQRARDFEQRMAEFKQSDNWRSFVKATRARRKVIKKVKGKAKKKAAPTVKVPESMPKKPENAFFAFMKSSAVAGKSPRDLRQAFADLPAEERSRMAREADERAAKYREDLKEFDNSAEGRKYRKDLANYTKRKRINDARAKFLKDEPKRPPTAYFAFVAENRPRIAAENPGLRGLGPLGKKIGEEWSSLPATEKQKYVDMEKEGKEAHDKAMEEFRQTPNYKKYLAIASRISGKKPLKAKKPGKKNVKVLAKPANLPKQPPNGFFLFSAEQRSAGGPASTPKGAREAWMKLGAEGQKKYQDQAAELNQKYENEMAQFRKSAEGKKYFREKLGADRKARLAKAKQLCFGKEGAPQEPKRPQSAYFIFVQEKRPTVEGGKLADVARKLTAMWSELDPEAKKVYEDRAEALKKNYEEEMQAYRDSPGYKKYSKLVANIGVNKAKAKAAQAKAKARAAAANAIAAKKNTAAKKGAGRGRGRGRGAAAPAARGRGKVAAPSKDDSDSDVMGSDTSSNSSKDDSDSD